MTVLSQQPRSVTEIWSASFKLYAESFTKVIGYSLIVFICHAWLSVHIINALPDTPQISFTESVTSSTDEDAVIRQKTLAIQQVTAMQEATSGLTTVQFVLSLLTCVLYSAMLYRIDNVANKRDDFVGILLPAILPVVKKLHLLIFAGIVYGIAVLIGTFLFVIPGIILLNSLLFFGVLILLEDMDVFDSLITSHRLVWGDWWRTSIVLFIPVFVFSVVIVIFGFVTMSSSISNVTHPSFLYMIFKSTIKFIIGINLLNVVVAPYFSVLGYLQYHDLKLRKNM